MTGRLKLILALWLLLLGVLQGKSVYTAEPPPGDFLVFAVDCSGPDDLKTRRAVRESESWSYETAQDITIYAYCHNDPVNCVDRLGLDEVLVNDSGTAIYHFVKEVNGARGGWLKKALDHVFLAKFDGSERRFVGSVALGPVSSGNVTLPNGSIIPLSDLQSMADKRNLGFSPRDEQLMLLNGDLSGWLARNEGSNTDNVLGAVDKVVSAPFQALAGPDALTILGGVADKHNGFSFGVDIGSRQYERGIITGEAIDEGIQVASVPLMLSPRNLPTAFRAGNSLRFGNGIRPLRFADNVRDATRPLGLPYKANVVTYQSGAVRSFTTQVDEVYYRVFSGSNVEGSYLSKVRPRSADWAVEAFALPPTNRADFIQEVLVPAGTRLQRSRAARNRWGRGGAEQFELIQPQPGVYQPVDFGPGIPFR